MLQFNIRGYKSLSESSLSIIYTYHFNTADAVRCYHFNLWFLVFYILGNARWLYAYEKFSELSVQLYFFEGLLCDCVAKVRCYV